MTLENIKFVENIVNQHKIRNSEELVSHLGYEFVIYPDVFSPFIAPSGRLGLAWSSMPIFKGKRILEVGCGSGIVSSLVALSGAEKVVGTDINPSAINNARLNAKALGVSNCVDAREGNLLDAVQQDEGFDLIFADLPFCDGSPTDYLERAFYDSNLESIKSLITIISSDNRFRNTSTYICFSNLERLDIAQFAKEQNLEFTPFLTHNNKWIEMAILEFTHR